MFSVSNQNQNQSPAPDGLSVSFHNVRVSVSGGRLLFEGLPDGLTGEQRASVETTILSQYLLKVMWGFHDRLHEEHVQAEFVEVCRAICGHERGCPGLVQALRSVGEWDDATIGQAFVAILFWVAEYFQKCAGVYAERMAHFAQAFHELESRKSDGANPDSNS